MDRTVWGYCRVSSVDQNLDRQKAAMLAEGIDEKHILCDKASGKDFERRTWNLLVGTDTSAPLLRKGDLLVVLSLDRLGRNYTEIRKQWAYITTEIGADIKVLDMPLLDTRQGKDLMDTFIADLVLQILSFVAQSERESIKKRQAEGIAAEKARGVKFGRPPLPLPENFHDAHRDWRSKKVTLRQER